MKTIYIDDLSKIFNKEDLAVMLGNFDGFHLGHQKLLKELLKLNTKKALLTFYPHPLTILRQKEFAYLDLISDKEEYLANKLDYLIVLKTTENMLNANKKQFLEFLINNNVKSVVCGLDYTFAKNKEGNVSDLKIFDLHVVPDFKIDNLRISSTLIRKYLSDSNIEDANKMLGRNYFIKGIVEKGSQIGRTIGFPTANVSESLYLIPKNGVYFGYVIINNIKYKAMINIGINPTINLIHKPRIEAHILDFNQDIYGKEIKVLFVKKLRDEKKFSSKEELIDMLKKNKDECKNLN